jgi:hypothetical protein
MSYRNKKLLAHAKHSPRCFCCGVSNDGTVVAAHANGSEYGKGMGQKAHDWAIAYVCYTCHTEIDQGQQTREERKDMWLRAHIRTMAYLFDSGILVAK